MSDIIISKKNETHLNIDCDSCIMMELSEHFSFEIEGAKFNPKVKAKVWDGIIKIFDTRFGTLPVGLYNELVSYATETLGYTTECKSTKYGMPNDVSAVTYEEVESFVTSLNIHSKGSPVDVREYQIQAIFNCIKNHRQISITPTGGGKSLIIYILFRWYMSHGMSTFMLVVPNLSLIKQMYSDAKDYSSHNGYDVEHNTQIVAEGADKKIIKSLVLCTFQSIYKMPASWFNDNVDVIMGDEIHGFKSETCKGIFDKATEVKYRFGVTGSLDKSAVNKMVLRGMLGDISKVKSTRDLIDEGFLSEIKIACILLKYGKETKSLVKPMDYKQEIDFLYQHEERNRFIRKLALQQKGNSLVLFNIISHGELLYEQIKANCTTQKVYFISGKIEADDREAIRNLVQASTTDCIIVASVGTMAVGVNIPRLHNIIFAAPTKSIIRVMQSIGRGLRKTSDKDYLRVFDLCDAINTSKSAPNYTYTHFIERLRIYSQEEHPYSIIEHIIEK